MSAAEAGEPGPVEAAAAWVVRLQAGPLDADGRAALRAWLAAAPRNAAAMDAAMRAWSGLGQVAPALAPALAPAPAPAPRRSPAARVPGWMWAGAGLAAACAAALVWIAVPTDAHYSTGPDRGGLVRLNDGTAIRLARDTDLSVHQSLLARWASLDHGQAEFDVVHDPRRMFEVRTRAVVVRDIGTRFAVRDRGGAIRVRLFEGRVALADRRTGRRLADLSPGQEARIGGPAAPAAVTVAQAPAPTAGGPDRMLLRETSLTRALAELEWRTGADIELKDGALGRIRVSGVFRTDSAPSFLSALAEIEPIRWRAVNSETFVVERAGR